LNPHLPQSEIGNRKLEIKAMAKNTTLAIDDERELVELVAYNLQKEGFLVKSAFDGGYHERKGYEFQT
jgi:hypothetical protein